MIGMRLNCVTHKVLLLSFGKEPRICIGQQFALIQIKDAWMHVLKNFSSHDITSFMSVGFKDLSRAANFHSLVHKSYMRPYHLSLFFT